MMASSGTPHWRKVEVSIYFQKEDRFDARREKMEMAVLVVNGKSIDVDVEPDTPLLWAIRENVGLTGTKYGCGIGQCGACTVHIDGAAARACAVTVADATGKKITTIEGLAENGAPHRVQQAWIDHDVPQCGYCQSGMIMAVAALLKETPHPTDKDIDAAIDNICRCGTFQQVREAIHAAAKA
jgi:isoquinoline 1-oxidoreductase alpha subunit